MSYYTVRVIKAVKTDDGKWAKPAEFILPFSLPIGEAWDLCDTLAEAWKRSEAEDGIRVVENDYRPEYTDGNYFLIGYELGMPLVKFASVRAE